TLDGFHLVPLRQRCLSHRLDLPQLLSGRSRWTFSCGFRWSLVQHARHGSAPQEAGFSSDRIVDTPPAARHPVERCQIGLPPGNRVSEPQMSSFDKMRYPRLPELDFGEASPSDSIID